MVRLLDRLLPTTGVWQHAVCGRCHWHGATMLVWSLSRPLTVTLSSHVATVRSGLGSTSKICNHANLPNEQSKAMFAIDSVLQCVDVLPITLPHLLVASLLAPIPFFLQHPPNKASIDWLATASKDLPPDSAAYVCTNALRLMMLAKRR